MRKNINRKEFLQQMAVLSGGFSVGFGNFQAKAFGHSINTQLTAQANGRVVVIIQLSGGNDGLNTVIPAEDSLYYNARPNIAIQKTEAIPLVNQMYLHPSMTGMKKLFDDDKMAIVQGVGYTNPNRSHFRATDIWNTGSDSNVVLDAGWASRYLMEVFPNFPNSLPSEPMAIQLGAVESPLFQSNIGSFATVFDDPNLFYQLVNGSSLDLDNTPNTLAGEELAFLKQIASASIQYSNVIRNAANKGKNLNTYPNTSLSRQLAIIAKLISGGLQTPIYLANIGGFDTHSNQLTQHANLLKNLSDAIINFQLDLEKLGIADQVCIMTFSEFGRRVKQNGTAGTDHGTAAPMFFIGKSVKSGIIGANPNLKVLDSGGDPIFQFDYRQTYTTVLRDHLGLSNTSTAEIFNRSFERLPIFKTATEEIGSNRTIDLINPWPNPASISIFVQYSVYVDQFIFLAVYDMNGQMVKELVNETKLKGEYNLSLDVSSWGKGEYLITLVSKSERITKKLMVV